MQLAATQGDSQLRIIHNNKPMNQAPLTKDPSWRLLVMGIAHPSQKHGRAKQFAAPVGIKVPVQDDTIARLARGQSNGQK